jgi:hypothetical protein
MDIYSGFVYIWYDCKRKWFCIGSHMGSLDDGYTSSTGFMDSAIKKRPHDFRRRILEFYYGDDPKELFALEQKYLDMIKDEELCLGENKHNGTIRYYNVKKNASGLSGKAASVLKKQFWDSERGTERKKIMSKEMSENNPIKKGNVPWNKGKKCPSISEAKKGVSLNLSDDQKRRNSEIGKEIWQRPGYREKMKNRKKANPEKIAASMRGKVRSDKTKNNISESLLGKPKSNDHKENLSKKAKERWAKSENETCPSCGFVGSGPAMKRWHFNNCKHKKEE